MQKFNISDEQMRGLIEHSANEPFPIKRSVPHEEAKKWEKHVTWCGFQCKVSPDNIDMMLSSSVFDDDSNTGKGLTVERWITCPQCFLRQDAENRYCDQCNAQLNY